jgi:5-methylcytosine-specific restriction protein A
MPRLAPVHVAQERKENYGNGRGGRPWRRKRDAVMARDKYMCQPCSRTGRITLADEVDHVTPQAEGGTDDEANLQAICFECHQLKTLAEARRGVAKPSRGT